MAHLTIEYSPTLDERADIPALCRTLHAIMLADPLFPDAGIRVRAYKAEFVLVADGLVENDFVAMTLNVGAGRTKNELRAAGNALFEASQAKLSEPLDTPHFALSLEIREIDAELSWKDTPIHSRLSKGK